MHGIGVHRLPRVKLARVAAERLQSRWGIRRVQLHRRKREGVSRHVIICRIGRLGFLRHHPDRRRIRPRHLSIRFFLAVQIAHQQPCSPHAVLPDFFHPDVCSVYKVAVVQLAILRIRRFVHIQKHARIFRDENEHARLIRRFGFRRWQGVFRNLRDRFCCVLRQFCFCRSIRRFDGKFRLCRCFRRFARQFRRGCCFRLVRKLCFRVCCLGKPRFFRPYRRRQSRRQHHQRQQQRQKTFDFVFHKFLLLFSSTATTASRPVLPP